MIFEISRGKKVHIVYTIPAKHYVRLLKDFIMKIKKTYSLVFFIYFFYEYIVVEYNKSKILFFYLFINTLFISNKILSVLLFYAILKEF